MKRAPAGPNPTGGHATVQTPDESGGSRPPGNAPAPSSEGLGSLSCPRWSSRDPRASSTQSLVSSVVESPAVRKRKLLVVYIHGFMGSNTSFGSFPAHVHNLLKQLLVETYVIHTKIYPRYKTYKSIEVARDNFSRWLTPHESGTTDVVLVGHSMGGVLAADVVLLPGHSPYNTPSPFRHRILGTISLDAPLLGLHPGVVVSGIASLFRPASSPPPAEEDTQALDGRLAPSQTHSPDPSIYSEDSPPSGALSPVVRPYPSNSTVDSSTAASPDPFFNPPFSNDVAFVDRGWFKNVVHFAIKHKEKNLVYAAAGHLLSHLEFGACLADYAALRTRYERLRRLEDADNWARPGIAENPVRVRFINYYTVCTRAAKKSEPGSSHGSPRQTDKRGDIGRLSTSSEGQAEALSVSTEGVQIPTPKVSIEEYSAEERRESLRELDPIPEPDPSETLPTTQPADSNSDADPSGPAAVDGERLGRITNQDTDLSFIPDPPPPPSAPDLDACADKESRRQAKKAFKLAQKAHAQAVKARDKAIKAHRKALDKQRRQAERDQQNKPAPAVGELRKPSPPLEENTRHLKPPEGEEQEGGRQQKEKGKKPPRPGKFCMLPPKTPDGRRDPSWVEVYMEGVDEVGAHCGLFLPGPHYERLVGDIGERIAGWVWEEASRRAVLGVGDSSSSSTGGGLVGS